MEEKTHVRADGAVRVRHGLLDVDRLDLGRRLARENGARILSGEKSQRESRIY